MALFPGFQGPQEQWRAELQSANKIGLLHFIDRMAWTLDLLTGGNANRESLLEAVRTCKRYGKWDAAHISHERMMADPHKFFREQDRRKRSAKRAARLKKKAGR